MSPEIPKDEKNYRVKGIACGSVTLPIRVILWLIAIALVSFTTGFGILVVSGSISSAPDSANSPFVRTAWITPNTTDFLVDGATSGNISVTMGAGEITINGGVPEPVMMEATTFLKAAEWQPDFSSSLDNSAKNIRMTDKGHTGTTWFPADSPNIWEIRITDYVPVALDVNIGAGDCCLNLGTMNLTRLNVHSGAGDTEINLVGYRGGKFDAAIVNGIGDLTLRIPRSGNTRITVHQGVGDITGSGFTLNNGAYVTAGYNPALPVNEITVKQGVGTFSLHMV